VLTFAYDGSLNGDWVAHYAVRLAANTMERRLRLVHILEGAPVPMLAERLERIAEECRILGVSLESESYERAGATVADRLLEVVPHGRDSWLVTGTRARPRNMAFFVGTVSARLLAARRFPIVAFRVVHPGILGQPGCLLLPVIDQASPARDALPLLRLFGSELHELRVVFVRSVSRVRFRTLGTSAAGRLLKKARDAAGGVEDLLRGWEVREPFFCNLRSRRHLIFAAEIRYRAPGC